MPKRAISVTLEADHILWLRVQAGTSNRRSVSAVLDRLVSEARSRIGVHEVTVRSAVGTIEIVEADPDLTAADRVLRAMFPLSERRASRESGRLKRSRRKGTARRGFEKT